MTEIGGGTDGLNVGGGGAIWRTGGTVAGGGPTHVGIGVPTVKI